MQAVLTSTHGKIGRGKQFFEAAFGRDEQEFEGILVMPEALIIHRFEHESAMRDRYPEYVRGDYTDTTSDKWRHEYNALNDEQRKAALKVIRKNIFTDEAIDVADEAICSVLRYYQIQREK